LRVGFGIPTMKKRMDPAVRAAANPEDYNLAA
jgi:hypothetical protein